MPITTGDLSTPADALTVMEQMDNTPLLVVSGRTITPVGNLTIGGKAYLPNTAGGAVTLAYTAANGTQYDLIAYAADGGTYVLATLPLNTYLPYSAGVRKIGTVYDYPTLSTPGVVLVLSKSLPEQYWQGQSDGMHLKAFGSQALSGGAVARLVVEGLLNGDLVLAGGTNFDPATIAVSRGLTITASGATSALTLQGDAGITVHGSASLALSSAGGTTLDGAVFGVDIGHNTTGGVTIDPQTGHANLAPQSAAGHVQMGGVNFEDYWPRRIEIDALPTADANTTWDTLSQSSTFLYGGAKLSSGAVNSVIEWRNIRMGAGTWKMELLHVRDTNRGQYQFATDFATIGTMANVGAVIEGYAAAQNVGQRDTVSGWTTVSGLHTIRLTITGKNAASSGFFGSIYKLVLTRTA